MTTTVGLAVALVAGAMLLRGTLQASLTREVDNTARQGGQEVVALINGNQPPPDPVPVVAGTLTVQVLGPDGRIVDASPGADRLVPLLPPAQAAEAAMTGRAVLLDGRPFGIPYLMRVVAVPANGHEIVLSAAAYTQVSDSMMALGRALLVGTPVLLLLLAGATWLVVGSTLRPIAALRRGAQMVTATGKARELPVPEARDEVRTLAITLNDMLARLDAAQRRQRSLVSDTAHELRSPIASIRAQLEVALDHPEQQDWNQTGRDVLADTLRLARLAEDLLVLARLDEHQPRTGAGKPVDLAALVTEEAERSSGGRVPVTARATGPCLVTGEVEGLRRMLRNLIDNALRYAKSGVEVSRAARGRGGRADRVGRRPGHPGRRPRAGLRPLRPARRRPQPGRHRDRRGRARPGHRAGHRPHPRRVGAPGRRRARPACGGPPPRSPGSAGGPRTGQDRGARRLTTFSVAVRRARPAGPAAAPTSGPREAGRRPR